MFRSIIYKYKNTSIIAKATLWFTIATVFQKGINFITVPIFTRLMNPDEYGIYSIYISWFAVISIFTSLKFDGSVFNKSMSKFKRDRNGYIASIQIETTIITILFYLLFLIFNEFVVKLTSLNFFLISLMFIQMITQPAYNFWMLRKRYEYNYKSFLIVVILTAIINTILGICFVYYIPNDKGTVRIISYVVVQSLVGLVLYLTNLFKGLKSIKWEYISYSTKFNLPLIPHYISQYILDQLDKIMIQKMCGFAYAAIYSVSYNISMILKIISDSLISALTPWYYEKLEKKDFISIKKIYKKLFICLLIMLSFFILISPEIFKFILPKTYYDGIYALPPICMSIVFLFMYSLFSLIEFYYEANKFSMFTSSIGAVLNFVLNYIFIKKFGFIAAGYTTLFCYMVFAVCHFEYSSIIIYKREKEYIYNRKWIYFCILFSTLIACVSPILFKFVILRIVILILILVLMFINRKQILKLLKKHN